MDKFLQKVHFEKVVLTATFVFSLFGKVATQAFSSTAEMGIMFHFEKSLLKHMDGYLAESRQRLDIFSSLSERIDDVFEESWNTSISTNVGCPFPERTTQDYLNPADHWIELSNHIKLDHFAGLVEHLGQQWMNYVPEEDGLLSAFHAIVRLQNIYQLDIRQLVFEGKIHNSKAAQGLNSEDCRNLAIVAIDRGMFGVASQIIDVAMEMKTDPEWIDELSRLRRLVEYGKAEMEKPEEYDYFYDSFEEILESQDSEKILEDITIDDLELTLSWELDQSKSSVPEDDTNNWSVEIQTYDPDMGFQIPDPTSETRQEYEALCRGDRMKYDNTLTCEHQYRNLPYYFWWKVETLQRAPVVVIYHDFITDNEASNIKQFASPVMMRSRVYQEDNKGVTDRRIGQSAFIDDTMADRLAKGINLRIAEATGLDAVNYAELLQISIYGMGGMYEPHYDYSRSMFKYSTNQVKPMGDRLATFMLYLNDVEAGGSTVFPLWRLAATPVKNAAILWYNQYKDGVSDPTTLHAGCPVLLGHKWVANKWIHEYGQEQRYPCELAPDSPPEHQPPENEEILYKQQTSGQETTMNY